MEEVVLAWMPISQISAGYREVLKHWTLLPEAIDTDVKRDTTRLAKTRV